MSRITIIEGHAGTVVLDTNGYAPNQSFAVVSNGSETYRGPAWQAHRHAQTGIAFAEQEGLHAAAIVGGFLRRFGTTTGARRVTMPSDPTTGLARTSKPRVTFERATEDGSYVARVDGRDVALIVREHNNGAHKWRVQGGALYFTLKAAKDAVRANVANAPRVTFHRSVALDGTIGARYVARVDGNLFAEIVKEYGAWQVRYPDGRNGARHDHLRDAKDAVRARFERSSDAGVYAAVIRACPACAQGLAWDGKTEHAIIPRGYAPVRGLGHETATCPTCRTTPRARLSVAHVREHETIRASGFESEDSVAQTAAHRLAGALVALGEGKYDRARGMVRLALETLDRRRPLRTKRGGCDPRVRG